MAIRNNLGDFMSIACFKAAIVGMEEILGVEGTAAALIAAGRKRGAVVAESLALVGKNPPVQGLADALDGAFGEAGTKLCTITEVTEQDGGYLIKTKETVCTAGEPSDSKRTCTYTMGAVIGFMESAYGTPMNGKHVANVINGSPTDDFLITPVGA